MKMLNLEYLEEKYPVLYFFTIIIFVCVLLVFIFYLLYDNENEKLKECYFQEPKTKECEFMLWKYENRDKSIHTTTTVPMYVYR